MADYRFIAASSLIGTVLAGNPSGSAECAFTAGAQKAFAGWLARQATPLNLTDIASVQSAIMGAFSGAPCTLPSNELRTIVPSLARGIVAAATAPGAVAATAPLSHPLWTIASMAKWVSYLSQGSAADDLVWRTTPDNSVADVQRKGMAMADAAVISASGIASALGETGYYDELNVYIQWCVDSLATSAGI
jgi:hypothetical protein